jgi:hypothetical protein
MAENGNFVDGEKGLQMDGVQLKGRLLSSPRAANRGSKTDADSQADRQAPISASSPLTPIQLQLSSSCPPPGIQLHYVSSSFDFHILHKL